MHTTYAPPGRNRTATTATVGAVSASRSRRTNDDHRSEGLSQRPFAGRPSCKVSHGEAAVPRRHHDAVQVPPPRAHDALAETRFDAVGYQVADHPPVVAAASRRPGGALSRRDVD